MEKKSPIHSCIFNVLSFSISFLSVHHFGWWCGCPRFFFLGSVLVSYGCHNLIGNHTKLCRIRWRNSNGKMTFCFRLQPLRKWNSVFFFSSQQQLDLQASSTGRRYVQKEIVIVINLQRWRIVEHYIGTEWPQYLKSVLECQWIVPPDHQSSGFISCRSFDRNNICSVNQYMAGM